MEEIWKIIPNTEEMYFASSYGRIYSNRTRKSLMRLFSNHKGYLTTQVHMDGRFGSRLVHRLIYITFYGEIPDGLFVDHIDYDKQNNRIENLRLLTNRENVHHSCKSEYPGLYYCNKKNVWNFQRRVGEERLRKTSNNYEFILAYAKRVDAELKELGLF